MKKTIILSVIALAFSAMQVNANSMNHQPLSENAQVSTHKTFSSPLHMAVVQGDLEMVKKLIDLGSDVNEKWNGMTPAMYAARYNNADILKVLISNGANLKLKCDKGHTAKYYAEVSHATEAEKVITEALSKKKS